MPLDLTLFTVRPASLNDASEMTSFVLDIAEETFLRDFSEEGKANFRMQHSLAKTLERLRIGYRYRLAERGSKLIGLIGIRDMTHLHHLFVTPEFQGQGLARYLWELEKAELLQMGAKAFTVNASLNAVPVYEQFGFVITSLMQDVGGVQFVPMRMDLA